MSDAVMKYRCNKTFHTGRRTFLEGQLYDECDEVERFAQWFDATIPPSDEVLAAAAAEQERVRTETAAAAAAEPAPAPADDDEEGDEDDDDDDEDDSYGSWSKARLMREARDRDIAGLSKASKQQIIDALEEDDGD